MATRWQDDHVATADGRIIPVRATARRPTWLQLPSEVRQLIEATAGGRVVDAVSTGSGFTPGFASRLDLADGRRVFVKAASSADDIRHGWDLMDAYREEIRKLRGLPDGIAAPPLLWAHEVDLAGVGWVLLGFRYVDGTPPRRPWRPDELRLVVDKLEEIAPQLSRAPEALELETFANEFGDYPAWLERVHERDGDSAWLATVEAPARESPGRCSGTGVAHLDLRDDNILIESEQRVWICDWNFPMLGAPWLDLVTVLLGAHGDGLDTEAILADHPLTRDVDPRSIDALLATLWLYFTVAKERDVPPHSPHLRDHQAWYDDVTRAWLGARAGIR